MRRKSILLTLALLLTVSPLAGTAWSQEDAPPHRHGAMDASGDEAPAEMQKPQMMAHHQQMQEHMQAMDAELDQLLEEARSASGEAKVEALVDVVAKLVEQRKAMHRTMQHSMMPMMKHREMMEKKGLSMEDCPMMKQMHAEPDTEPESEEGGETDDDHAAHH